MNLNSNGYVLAFASGVCIVVSAVLAFLYNNLKPTQDAAAEFDRQKNVMIAAGLCDNADKRSRPELEKLYQERVQEFVVDTVEGVVLNDKSPKDIPNMNKAAEKADKKHAQRYRAVATTRQAGKVEAYVLPIQGKGLWSTLFGYLALDADKNTVRGITFYKHGETPGLGGEVENPDWTAQWKGKTIRDEAGKLVAVTIKKGKVNPGLANETAHYVDGLSGATLTCNGVNAFVKKDLQAFATYLEKN